MVCYPWADLVFLILNRPYKMNDNILDNESLLETTYNCQTKLRGTHDEDINDPKLLQTTEDE